MFNAVTSPVSLRIHPIANQRRVLDEFANWSVLQEFQLSPWAETLDSSRQARTKPTARRHAIGRIFLHIRSHLQQNVLVRTYYNMYAYISGIRSTCIYGDGPRSDCTTNNYNCPSQQINCTPHLNSHPRKECRRRVRVLAASLGCTVQTVIKHNSNKTGTCSGQLRRLKHSRQVRAATANKSLVTIVDAVKRLFGGSESFAKEPPKGSQHEYAVGKTTEPRRFETSLVISQPRPR
eukprot:1194346-Prorocentrum_minimum.AAC.2